MPWFIKHETFTADTAALALERRRPRLEAHRRWLAKEPQAGRQIRSGFLVDERRRPGGGGLLIFEAQSYEEALAWVSQDPMSPAGLVDWTLQEWISVSGDGWP